MADTVRDRILLDGPRNVILHLTNKSDGTGESAVKKLNMVNLSDSPRRVSLEWIQYDIGGMEVELLWEATPNVTIDKFSAGQNVQDYRIFGGKYNDYPGATGNILLTTTNHSSGDSYSITMGLKKKYK